MVLVRTSAQNTKVVGFRWCGIWYIDRGRKRGMQRRKKGCYVYRQSKKDGRKERKNVYHGEKKRKWYKPLKAEIYLLIVSQSIWGASGKWWSVSHMGAGSRRMGNGWVSFRMQRHIWYMYYMPDLRLRTNLKLRAPTSNSKLEI